MNSFVGKRSWGLAIWLMLMIDGYSVRQTVSATEEEGGVLDKTMQKDSNPNQRHNGRHSIILQNDTTLSANVASDNKLLLTMGKNEDLPLDSADEHILMPANIGYLDKERTLDLSNSSTETAVTDDDHDGVVDVYDTKDPPEIGRKICESINYLDDMFDDIDLPNSNLFINDLMGYLSVAKEGRDNIIRRNLK